MNKTKVVMRRLQSEHNPDTFTLFRPLGEKLREESGVAKPRMMTRLTSTRRGFSFPCICHLDYVK